MLLMVDSSPQGGHDYVLTAVTRVRACDLIACYEKADLVIRRSHKLAKRASSRASSDQGALQVADEDLRDALTFLATKLHLSSFTPTAIGSKRGSVVHKMHAVLHSAYLHLGDWDKIALFSRAISAKDLRLGDRATLAALPSDTPECLVSLAAGRQSQCQWCCVPLG